MGINGYWYAFFEIEPQHTDGQGANDLEQALRTDWGKSNPPG